MSSEPGELSILLTFAGRKAYLADLLRRSPRATRVLAVDADETATVRWTADGFAVVPPVSEEDAYVEALCAFCRDHAVDAVAGLNDMDLLVLAKRRSEIEAAGARVLGAEEATLEALQDKLAVGHWLEERGFRYPETSLPAVARCPKPPFVIKQRFGQGSQGLRACRSPVDPKTLGDDMIIQRLLEGDEFHLDILRAEDGEVKAVVPKLKLAMADGSTDKARSVDAPELLDLGRRLGEAVGHVGSIDVDVMVSEGVAYVLDVNARLGGGLPFTAVVCPRFVDALLDIAGGGTPAAFMGEYRQGVDVHRTWRYFEVCP